MTNSTNPGIFSVHAGTKLRFFDSISEAQDFAEQYDSAIIRKDYGSGWVDVAKYDGSNWSYIHRKTAKKKKQTMITAVITCMGRREHLEATLPYAIQTFDKVIVVDWSCPQNSGDYAALEGASVIRKYDEKFFSGSRAKNYGAKLVNTDYLAFVDADTLCMPGLREELATLIGERKMVLSARAFDGSDVNDTVGFLVCKTSAFWNVGGFDETWIGWGAEDIHLRGKLFLDEKLEVVRLSGMVLGALAHSNELRSANREAPIEKTAVYNHKTLENWFASRGISDYSTNPKIKDIVFIPNYPS